MSETIVTGKKYRILTDVAQKVWQRVSFWTKSSDVEFNDGKTAETKVGAISGITDSLVSNSSNIAASAKAVSELNGNLDNINVYVGEDSKLHFVNKAGADTALNFSSVKDVSLNMSIYTAADATGYFTVYSYTNIDVSGFSKLYVISGSAYGNVLVDNQPVSLIDDYYPLNGNLLTFQIISRSYNTYPVEFKLEI